MSRSLKPHVVDEVSSPNGLIRLPVYFDRTEKDFYVEVTGRDDRVRADSVAEVKKLARELLAKAIEYKWEGIITIEMGESYDAKYKQMGTYNYRGQRFGARVEFEFDRMERSPHPTREGHAVYRKHTLDFEEGKPDAYSRKQREKNADLKQWGCSAEAIVLPYDEETWAGLQAVKRAIDAAQAQLEALIARKDLADRLRLVGKQAPMPILPEAVGATKGRR